MTIAGYYRAPIDLTSTSEMSTLKPFTSLQYCILLPVAHRGRQIGGIGSVGCGFPVGPGKPKHVDGSRIYSDPALPKQIISEL